MSIVAISIGIILTKKNPSSRASSPRGGGGVATLKSDTTIEKIRMSDSPGSMSPSVHSSDERPRSRNTVHYSRPQSQSNRSGKVQEEFIKIIIDQV